MEQEKIIELPGIDREIIENQGIIKKADIKFSKRLNLIVGDSGTGKTAVIQYLLNRYDSCAMASGNRIMFEIQKALNTTTLVLDDSLGRLDSDKLIRTLRELVDSGRQIIATLHSSQFKTIDGKIKANIIHTKDFELNK